MILTDLIQTLSATEKKKLGEALASPFFNKNEKLSEVYKYLQQHLQDNTDEILFKKALFKHLFPRKKYDDLVVRHLISKLLRMAETVLSTIEMQQNEDDAALYYLNWLDRKGLQKQFEQKASKHQAALKPQLAGVADYYVKYRFTQAQQIFSNRHQLRYDNRQLQQVSDSFDQYFIANKLKIACAAFSLQTVYKEPFQIGFMDTVIDETEAGHPAVQQPLIKLYYLGLQTLRSENHYQYFKLLKAELTQEHIGLQKEDLLDLFILAQNYCIRRVNSGEASYFNELFELYKVSLKAELVQHDAIQFPPAFKNIVSVALKLKAFDWVEEFIKTHTDYIQPTYRNDYLNYNLARVYFEQQDFEKAQNYLNKLSYKDLFIGLSARLLLAKVYYELGETDLLFSQLQSFKQYLKRKGIMANHQKSYLLNVKYITRLLNLNVYDKKRKHILKTQIEQEKVLTEKIWILEKFEELKG